MTKRIIQLNISMDDCAKSIGISKATLSRIENGNMPDLLNFFKVVKWLGNDGSKYIK
jgi:transcriptional regulator with XRE-family HTH domain